MPGKGSSAPAKFTDRKSKVPTRSFRLNPKPPVGAGRGKGSTTSAKFTDRKSKAKVGPKPGTGFYKVKKSGCMKPRVTRVKNPLKSRRTNPANT